MNNERRELIKEVISLIKLSNNAIVSKLNDIIDSIDVSISNLEDYPQFENRISNLEDERDGIQEIINNFEINNDDFISDLENLT